MLISEHRPQQMIILIVTIVQLFAKGCLFDEIQRYKAVYNGNIFEDRTFAMFFLGFRDGPRAMGIRVVFNVRGTGTVRAGRKGLTLLTEFLNETADIAGFCVVERAILLLFPVKV